MHRFVIIFLVSCTTMKSSVFQDQQPSNKEQLILKNRSLLIPFSLCLIQGVIVSFFGHKFLMGAILYDTSILKD